MPLYEYACDICGHRFEILQALGGGAEGLSCSACGSAVLVKQFSTFAAAATGTGARESSACPPAGCCRGTPT